MVILSIRHRGLQLLFEKNSTRLLRQNQVERIRTVLYSLEMAESIEEFIRGAMPGWRIHRLTGERQNEWSVSVSGNWRITFIECDNEIQRVNLEDYH